MLWHSRRFRPDVDFARDREARHAAGMRALFLRREPWGYIHATRPEVAYAHARIDTLDQLPEVLRCRKTDYEGGSSDRT